MNKWIVLTYQVFKLHVKRKVKMRKSQWILIHVQLHLGAEVQKNHWKCEIKNFISVQISHQTFQLLHDRLLRIAKIRVRYLGFHIQHCLGCDVITHRLGHLLKMLGNNGRNAWPFFLLILREVAPWWGECQNLIYSFTVSRPQLLITNALTNTLSQLVNLAL